MARRAGGRPRAVIIDSDLTNNRIGLHAYQEKWAYNRGGFGLMVDSRIADSREHDLVIERRSELQLVRSSAESVGAGRSRVTTVTSIVPVWREVLDLAGPP